MIISLNSSQLDGSSAIHRLPVWRVTSTKSQLVYHPRERASWRPSRFSIYANLRPARVSRWRGSLRGARFNRLCTARHRGGSTGNRDDSNDIAEQGATSATALQSAHLAKVPAMQRDQAASAESSITSSSICHIANKDRCQACKQHLRVLRAVPDGNRRRNTPNTSDYPCGEMTQAMAATNSASLGPAHHSSRAVKRARYTPALLLQPAPGCSPPPIAQSCSVELREQRHRLRVVQAFRLPVAYATGCVLVTARVSDALVSCPVTPDPVLSLYSRSNH